MTLSRRHRHMRSVVLLGHGSRSTLANDGFALLVDRTRHGYSVPVTHGYLDYADPSALDALLNAGRTSKRVLVLPIFLMAAEHVRVDVPRNIDDAIQLLGTKCFEVSPPIGAWDALLELAQEQLSAEIAHSDSLLHVNRVVVVARGSSDHAATDAFCDRVALLTSGLRRSGNAHSATTAFMAGSTRRLDEVLSRMCADNTGGRIFVLPFLMSKGAVLDEIDVIVDRYAAGRGAVESVTRLPEIGGAPAFPGMLRTRIDRFLCEPT